MSSTAVTNGAAMSAVLKGASEAPQQSGRRSSKAGFVPRGPGHYSAVPSSLPNNETPFTPFAVGAMAKTSPSAVVDGPPLESLPENEKGNNKARVRRASEGAYLRKGEGKRVSGGELRCEKCGKGYKHSSCLTKHLSVSQSLPFLHAFPCVTPGDVLLVKSIGLRDFPELTSFTGGNIRRNGPSPQSF